MAEPLRLRYVTPVRSALAGGAVLSIVCSDAGTQAGTAHIGGTAMEILSWTPSLIRARLPARPAGTYPLSVTTSDARTDTLLSAVTYADALTGLTAFDDIETGVIQRLDACGLAVSHFAVSDLDTEDRFRLIKTPAVNVAIVDAVLGRVAVGGRYKATCSVLLSLAVRNIQSEEARRRAVFPLVLGVLSMLTEKTLTITSGSPPTVRTVDCKPLVPLRVRLVAENQAVAIWQIEMRTSTLVPVMPEEEAGDLIKLGLNYYLRPGDETEDAADIAEIEQ